MNSAPPVMCCAVFNALALAQEQERQLFLSTAFQERNSAETNDPSLRGHYFFSEGVGYPQNFGKVMTIIMVYINFLISNSFNQSKLYQTISNWVKPDQAKSSNSINESITYRNISLKLSRMLSTALNPEVRRLYA